MPCRLTGTGGRRVWCLSLACRGSHLDFPGILLLIGSVRTTGKKGQKGERVALNQKGQIAKFNQRIQQQQLACCWRREFWLLTAGQKPNRKKNSGGKSLGTSLCTFQKPGFGLVISGSLFCRDLRPEEKHGSKKRCHPAISINLYQKLSLAGLKEGGVPKKQMHPRRLNHHSGCFK